MKIKGDKEWFMEKAVLEDGYEVSVGGEKRPTFVMLIGLPASGKSTFRNEHGEPYVVLSSDDYIEQRAAANGVSYTEVFADVVGDATKHVNRNFREALSEKASIMWDQTNLTPKKRRGVLSQVPKHYVKIAVYFEIDEKLRQERLLARPGKTIPVHVDDKMRQDYVRPSVFEGFDIVLSAEAFRV